LGRQGTLDLKFEQPATDFRPTTEDADMSNRPEALIETQREDHLLVISMRREAKATRSIGRWRTSSTPR
jgi:hypothetical protein